ncbi:MAG: PAS domain-containing hybrid sensor histidine kinase/response regulator [Pseudomonadota bacterium]
MRGASSDVNANHAQTARFPSLQPRSSLAGFDRRGRTTLIDAWLILGVALGYVGLLFAVAHLGDKRAQSAGRASADRPLIYALTLAVYCTSWTFFGSVGLATTSGFGFIPVYLGAILMIGFGAPFVVRLARIAKAQNITSAADFLAARYGKSQSLAALVTLIAVAGTIPYIALQLKAVAASVEVLIGPAQASDLASRFVGAGVFPLGDMAFVIALSMAAFAILFGTRHIDATEHQDGLMLAVAAESIVKLVAFLAVGLFVTFVMFDGVSDLWSRAREAGFVDSVVTQGWSVSRGITITLLSFACILLLPRQFHVAIVEAQSAKDVKTAAWLFPLYLVAINIFVLPIALAGLLSFAPGSVDADMFVLALPLAADAKLVAMFAFIGGLSAATAMVIVASIALAIMVCNEVIVPLLVRRTTATARDDAGDLGPLLLNIRRATIIVVLLLAYGFHQTIGQSQALASIGLLSFAAIAQFAPAFFIGMFWRGGTARGAIAGISVGFAVWSYTMFVPWIAEAGMIGPALLSDGLFGIEALRPQSLFGAQLDPLVHGVFFSLTLNTLAFISASLMRAPFPIERLQANLFIDDEPRMPTPGPTFRLWRASITVEDLIRTAARYVGRERASRSFTQYAEEAEVPLQSEQPADVDIIRFTERLLASAIGTASARLVLSLLLRRHDVGERGALKLLDDASEAIQYNRELLQSALDRMGQGVSVFDADLRLICWNSRFRDVMDLPPAFGAVGVPLDRIMEHKRAAGDYGSAPENDWLHDQVNRIARDHETFQDVNERTGRVLEIASSAMPQGGVVVTYTDITERVATSEALARANSSLEKRVGERTSQLMELNSALERARHKADKANLDKTRFLAAAGHDILQPLNAARLFAGSLSEKARGSDFDELATRIDSSLEAVEEIIGALLDISRLDAHAMKPDITVFPLRDLFERLRLEFEPLASTKGLELRIVETAVWVQSDRRLLRRLLQNLISNAIKYTEAGTVLVGCRQAGETVAVQVLDTGRGISEEDREAVFEEFKRLDATARKVRGLGLGLSIVKRIADVLGHPMLLRSRVDAGTVFSVDVPRRPAVVSPIEEKLARPLGHDVSGMYVLVIDNEEEIVAGTAMLLSDWGCEVATACRETDALALLQQSDRMPDVVLADYHLEETNGTATVAAIREAVGSDVPAIIITADRSTAVREEIETMGLTLMRKPVRPAALRAAVYQFRQSLQAAE